VVLAALGLNFRVCLRQGWWEPGAGQRGTDFTALYSAGELARHGENVYDYERSSTPRRPFIYPPMFAVFPMAPLSLLPHNAALAVYWALNVLLLGASLWLLRKAVWEAEAGGTPAVQLPFWRRPWVGLGLALAVCADFLNDNQRLGNANLYILFLLALALYLLVKKREFWAGLAVALAMAFKVTPGLFGLYLLWSRRGKALAGGALGVVLFLVLVPGAVLGFSQNWEMLQAFARHAGGAIAGQREPGSGEGRDAGISVGWKKGTLESRAEQAAGVSLRGMTQRLLSPSVAHGRAEDSEERTVNVLNLTPRQAARVGDILALLLLGFTIALTAPRWARERGYPLVLSFGLVTSAMLLISPLTRKAHLVVLLIPAAALSAMLQQEKLSGRARGWAWTSLLVLALHGVVFSPDIVGKQASEAAQALGVTTLAVLLVYVATAVGMRARKSALKLPGDAAN
jgi:hypothetical protein